MAGRAKVAILGGGMAGMTAAWRLSEPGWQERFESVTVYQRGWRLGGKGASSRGANGRIEEHGLHVWLGHYENAFRLMRECYDQLDRSRTAPGVPIQTWQEAFIPAPDIGIFDNHGGTWRPWTGHFSANAHQPGELESTHVYEHSELARRATRLLRDLLESFDENDPIPQLTASPGAPPPRTLSRPAAAVLAASAMLEGFGGASEPITKRAGPEVVAAFDTALAEVRNTVELLASDAWGARQAWHVVGITVAVIRGCIADGLWENPSRMRDINDEEFLDWVRRHGASEAMVTSTYVRGLYDLVFGHVGGDASQMAFGAGIGVFLSTKTMLEYRGNLFWKMAAGMGDVVFAPMYELLRRRGVDFEFFHRVDALHVGPDGVGIDAVTMGRQARLADGARTYEPLIDVLGLPVFPAEPLVDQLDADPRIRHEPLESIWCTWPDAELRTLRRGRDFDQLVFAIPPPMAQTVCRELIERRREWRDMVDNIATVATQALQLWLRDDEPTLGWNQPGSTMTGYVDGFDTWASMPQLLPVEDWPDEDAPRAVAYFCNTMDAPWPPDSPWPEYAAREFARVRATAVEFCNRDLSDPLPGVADERGGFRWDLLCGAGAAVGEAAIDSQYWRANVDPSDRYVQSLPGTDKFRLRPDESGFDNLVLAGDWTDNGINAGCIEAAVVSGLQAANALLGRHRHHRILGSWIP